MAAGAGAVCPLEVGGAGWAAEAARCLARSSKDAWLRSCSRRRCEGQLRGDARVAGGEAGELGLHPDLLGAAVAVGKPHTTVETGPSTALHAGLEALLRSAGVCSEGYTQCRLQARGVSREPYLR